MKPFNSKRVIVTSLALTLLLGGGALYASQQQAQAETADSAKIKQQTAGQHSNRLTQQKHDANNGTVKPFGKDGEGRFGPSSALAEEASPILGIDKDTLAAALKDKALVDIAKEKGISEADLIAKLEAVRSGKIDEAVKAGKLTSEQADKIKANMPKHLKFMVNHKGFGSFHGGKGSEMKKAMLPAPDKLASYLNLSEEQLKAQLNEGKSLAEIAQAQGISKDKLIAKIKEDMTPWIEKMVDHKRGSDAPSKQGKTSK